MFKYNKIVFQQNVKLTVFDTRNSLDYSTTWAYNVLVIFFCYHILHFLGESRVSISILLDFILFYSILF
jgi:hypothetical protein